MTEGAARGGIGGARPRGDAGPVDAAAGTGLCTRTPDEWLATCDGDEPAHCGRGHSVPAPGHDGRHPCDRGPSARECDDLASADEPTRESTALSINLRVLGAPFGALHFSHGYRRELPLSTYADTARPEDVFDANRAFPSCVDAGVLVPWVTTPVCGDDGRGAGSGPIAGPEQARCLAFDTGCTRGRYDAASGCCAISAMAAGTLCGERGDGQLCDGGGRCVSAASVPEAARTNDPFDWLHIYPSGVPALGLHPTDVAVTPVTGSPPPGLSGEMIEVWAPVDPSRVEVGFEVGVDLPDPSVEPPPPIDPYDADVLAILPASLSGTDRVTILRTASTGPLHAVAYAGPAVPHALVLPIPSGETPTEVWVVRGELDLLPAVHPDGSTAGAVLVSCQPIDSLAPAAAPTGASCFVTEAELIIVGLEVALAWLPIRPELIEPIGGTLLGCRPASTPGFGCRGDARPQPSRPGATAVGTAGCREGACSVPGASGACSGNRACIGPHLSACLVASGPSGPASTTSELCDGIDNDCDGTVDEGALAACNDGIDCTVDSCTIAGGCSHVAAATMCGDDGDGATCTTSVCAGPTGPARTRMRVPAADVPADRPLDCARVFANNWCTSVWDSCNCNGPEACMPATASVANPSGCGPPPPSVGGTPPDPCDTDGVFCTVESLCCEPSDGGFCRLDAALPPATVAARDALCTGGSTANWPASTPGAGAPVGPLPVRCTPTVPPGVTIPRCIDFNPCTTDNCNFVTDTCATPTPLAGVTRSPESISTPFGSVSGPSCVGETPFPFGCANMICGGTAIGSGGAVAGAPGLCGEIPTSFGAYPAGTNSAVCTPEETDDRCGVYRCNGGGNCVPFQSPSVPTGGTTLDCGYGDPLTDCVHDACVGGVCVRDYPDSSMCIAPAGCGLPWRCDAALPYSFEDTDVVRNCRPVVGCYVGGGPGGGLDGECFAPGEVPDRLQCTYCDGVSIQERLSFDPPGTACTDRNDCTNGDVCGAAGRCQPGECNRSIPSCADEFCGAGG